MTSSIPVPQTTIHSPIWLEMMHGQNLGFRSGYSPLRTGDVEWADRLYLLTAHWLISPDQLLRLLIMHKSLVYLTVNPISQVTVYSTIQIHGDRCINMVQIHVACKNDMKLLRCQCPVRCQL